MYSYGPSHMAVQKQDDQHEHTYSNYVRIRDVVQKTCLRRWTIGESGEKGSGISVLLARHDDDNRCILYIFFIKNKESQIWCSEISSTFIHSLQRVRNRIHPTGTNIPFMRGFYVTTFISYLLQVSHRLDFLCIINICTNLKLYMHYFLKLIMLIEKF